MPNGIDLERPSASRVYDYLLGGAHNFEVDRRLAERMLAAYPELPLLAQANRAFLRRAVRLLVGRGIRQFLDVGSGIPTVGHVHEIAQTAAPDARVVYVDLDRVAVMHSREILAGNDRAVAIQEDVRRPEQILQHPALTRLLDLDEPVAVLLAALLQFLPAEVDLTDIVSRLMARLAAGSYLVVSHGTDDGPQDMAPMREICRRAGIDMTWRSRDELLALFAGCELIEPGLVWVPQWHPELSDGRWDHPALTALYGAAGYKVA
jgi:hypothetical protein